MTIAKSVWRVLGALVLIFLPIEFVAWLLADFHIDKPGIGGHPTAGRPQHVAPYRLRVVKREFHNKQLNIDEDGFRSGKSAGHLIDDWSPSKYNVFVFGGSAAFGWTVDDEQTLPAQLEILAKRQNLNWRVYNFGVTDYSIHDEVQILIDQLREGRIPRMVVFYDGANESGRAILDSTRPDSTTDEALTVPYRAGDYEHEWVAEMVERGQRVNLDNLASVKLAKRLCRRLGLCEGRTAPGVTVVEAPEYKQLAHAQAAAQAYIQYARMVDALGREFGFRTLFVLQPIGGCIPHAESYPFPYLGPPRRWQTTYTPKLYAEITRKAPDHLKIANLCSSLNEKILEGMQPFNASLHLNAEGYGYMANLIFDLIQNDRP